MGLRGVASHQLNLNSSTQASISRTPKAYILSFPLGRSYSGNNTTRMNTSHSTVIRGKTEVQWQWLGPTSRHNVIRVSSKTPNMMQKMATKWKRYFLNEKDSEWKGQRLVNYSSRILPRLADDCVDSYRHCELQLGSWNIYCSYSQALPFWMVSENKYREFSLARNNVENNRTHLRGLSWRLSTILIFWRGWRCKIIPLLRIFAFCSGFLFLFCESWGHKLEWWIIF